MKMTVDEARVAYGALAKAGKIPLSGVVSYRIAKLTKDLKPFAESSDEAQQKLLQEVGEEDAERPGTYKIKDMKRWTDEMKAMMAEEIEVPTSITFKVSDFGDAKIEPEIFVGLDKFLSE